MKIQLLEAFGYGQTSMVEKEQLYTDEFEVTVDYSKSLEQMIEEARFDYLNSGITEEHFPKNGTGITKISLRLFQFPTPKSTDEIIEYIQVQGYKPAKIEELVRFATQHPDIQRSGYPVVGLGTIWKRAEKEEVVPVLRGGSDDRNMHLLRTANTWNPSERFAAVREKA